MKENNKRECLKIIDKLEDINIEEEVDNVLVKDPLQELKIVLCDFFKDRLSVINKEENFKEVVKLAITKRIAEKEISTTQLISLFKIIFNESTLAVDSLLSVFKPTPGAVSPLLTKGSSDSGTPDNVKNLTENLSQEDNQKLDKLMRLLTVVINEKDTKKG